MSNLNFMSHFQLDPKFSHQKVRQETRQLRLLYFHFRNEMLQEKNFKMPISLLQCELLKVLKSSV